MLDQLTGGSFLMRYTKEFKSLEKLEKAMIKYIKYYNNERIMEKTKGLSPLTYRQQSFVQLGY